MKKLLPFSLLLFTLNSFAQNCPVQVTTIPATCSNTCDGQATALGSGNPPFTYQWQTGQTTQSVSGLCPGTYTVIVVNGAACTGMATFTITSPPPIFVVTTGQASTSCISCNGIMLANATGGTSPYFYMWQPSGCSTATCSGVCPGTYTVTVTDANGCTGTSTLTVGGPAGPNFTVSATNATAPACNNGTASAVTSNPGTYTYAWTPGGQTTQTATGLAPGVYTVCVTNTSNGCSACQPVTVSCATGIQDNNGVAGISLAPNPANNNISVLFTNPLTAPTTVFVYSILGDLVQKEIVGANRSEISLDISKLARGVYFIRVENKDGRTTHKFVKE